MHTYERKLNRDHAYMLVVTLIALVVIIGNAVKEHDYSECKKSYERQIKVQDNTYLELQEQYTNIKNKLEILTDEYNELLEQSK